ncbi:protein arginine kinase [Alkalibaculum bacchi]|uniref:Protein-arginine kinase n=1 Tax=Alkalibaculum bacchi TaxID=645887 RepID=A0A366HXX6_9FIRM|nr:protein arginine kinase [Alkalibaculum bacchi]RBP58602.1 protein arginine kinase [Alkalibaculum bacchi]
MSTDYKEKDIVISSRVRLARNIKDLPFAAMIQEEDSKKAIKLVEGALNNQDQSMPSFNKVEVKDLNTNEKRMLVEKHLASKEWSKNDEAAVFIRKDENVSIMVNEEDHIRIQCILDSFQLRRAFDIANEIDDILEEKIRYAFDDKYGYLTACPSNVGTGMRASVMIHLPSLTLGNQMNDLIQTLARFGITIRGIYGEGSQSLGDLYQISNQITLGLNEETIIRNLHSVIKEIIKRERNVRNEMLINNRIYLEDKVFRALGILENARTITVEESMKLISLIRLGTDLEIIEQDISEINRLILSIQPGILSHTYGIPITNKLDNTRAEHIRKILGKNNT